MESEGTEEATMEETGKEASELNVKQFMREREFLFASLHFTSFHTVAQ